MFYNVTLPSMLKSNPKRFWNIVNKTDSFHISLCIDAGDTIDPSQCADVLNDTFFSAFSPNVIPLLPKLENFNFVPMDSISVDTFGIAKIIKSLRSSSSFGCHGINTIVSHIFSQSLDEGTLPDDWKVAKVIPLYKSGDRHCPGNYRPISLASIPCKILEHIIYSHLVEHLEFHSFFLPNQHGFRRTFSCETQLVSFVHDLHRVLDRGKKGNLAGKLV